MECTPHVWSCVCMHIQFVTFISRSEGGFQGNHQRFCEILRADHRTYQSVTRS